MVCHTPFEGVEIHTKVSKYRMGVKRLTISGLERMILESYDLETDDLESNDRGSSNAGKMLRACGE
jgi:hypothetical protein